MFQFCFNRLYQSVYFDGECSVRRSIDELGGQYDAMQFTCVECSNLFTAFRDNLAAGRLLV